MKNITFSVLGFSLLILILGSKRISEQEYLTKEIIGISISKPVLSGGNKFIQEIKKEIYIDLIKKQVFYRKKNSDEFKLVNTSSINSSFLFDKSRILEIKEIIDQKHFKDCHSPYYRHFYITFYFDSNIENDSLGYLNSMTYEIGEISGNNENVNCQKLNQLLLERKRLGKLLNVD